jgi:hypothetical protein
MRRDTTRSAVRLPERFVYTVLRVAVAGTVACSNGGTVVGGGNDGSADARQDAAVADASQDAVVIADSSADSRPSDGAIVDSTAGDVVAQDSATDDAPADAGDECTNPPYYCGSSGTVDGAVCPGPICELSQCPPGCEPFV